MNRNRLDDRADASIEDIDWRAARGLDRTLVMKLAEGRWIDDAINLLITGASDPDS